MPTIDRPSIGVVTELTGSEIILRLDARLRGHVASHGSGISSIASPGDLVGFHGGTRTIVATVTALKFGEDRSVEKVVDPRQEIHLTPVGTLARRRGVLEFRHAAYHLPPLGSAGFALADDEVAAVYSRLTGNGRTITLGEAARCPGVEIRADISTLLGRHTAVLGGTGEGKTTFVAGLIQQTLERFPGARVVVFDINGEYASALEHIEGTKVSVLGGHSGEDAGRSSFKIPYFALNRAGLVSTLLPSERTQMPALRFGIESLAYVESDGRHARPVGTDGFPLVDDCRENGARDALIALDHLRNGSVELAQSWPHMRALACLIGEWGCLGKNGRGDAERNAFRYGNVQPLVNRIRGLCEDSQFRAVVDIEGGPSTGGGGLDLDAETRSVIEHLFGSATSGGEWRAHVLDLHLLPQDLMPVVLGSLLDLYASELFQRGPGKSHPTLLVLEEAHHYLRQPSEPGANGMSLAYERLAKEGRKFNLSLLVSTQRPAELSATVLSQCGTWCVFRLASGIDQAAAADMGNWERGDARQVRSLPRGEAIVIGAAVNLPAHIRVRPAIPPPDSRDADFGLAWASTSPGPTTNPDTDQEGLATEC